MFFKGGLVSVLLSLSSMCFAVQSWENAKVKQVIMHDNGSDNYKGVVQVIMHSKMPDDALPQSNCVASPSYYKARFAIDLARDTGNAMYTAVMAAFMANKDITVTVNNKCVDGMAVVRNIYINH